MLRIKTNDQPKIELVYEGAAISANEGDSVAAALLAAGQKTFRATPIQGVSRGPFCMMGVCMDCLVEIDGIPNQQACMTIAKEGMIVNPQKGACDVLAIGGASDE